jgi:hypothetical protein
MKHIKYSFLSILLSLFNLTDSSFAQEKMEMVEDDPAVSSIILDHDRQEMFRKTASKSLIMIKVKEKASSFIDSQLAPVKNGMGAAIIKKHGRNIFLTSMLLTMNADAIVLRTIYGGSCDGEILYSSDNPPLSLIACRDKKDLKDIVPLSIASKKEFDILRTVFTVLLEFPDHSEIGWGSLEQFRTPPLQEYFLSSFVVQFGAPLLNASMKLAGMTFRSIGEKDKKTLVAPCWMIEKFLNEYNNVK